jgi:hypothetical protein
MIQNFWKKEWTISAPSWEQAIRKKLLMIGKIRIIFWNKFFWSCVKYMRKNWIFWKQIFFSNRHLVVDCHKIYLIRIFSKHLKLSRIFCFHSLINFSFILLKFNKFNYNKSILYSSNINTYQVMVPLHSSDKFILIQLIYYGKY